MKRYSFLAHSEERKAKTCIITLGMHRSGTSLLSGMLHTLGVDLGQAIMAANSSNPKGYFENDRVMHLNNRVMETIGFAWDDPFPWPHKWWQDEKLAPLAIELGEILYSEFDQPCITGFKDPRMSVLLPWWQACLNDLGYECRYAIAIRHPLEVAASLAVRNGLSREKSVLLWMNHMLAAEKYTRRSPRAFVFYPDLLQQPTEVLKGIISKLRLNWEDRIEVKEAKLRALIDRDLRHHSNQEDLDEDCQDLALRVFDALVDISRNQNDPALAQKFLYMMDEAGGTYTELQRWFCTREFHAGEVVARRLRYMDEKQQREDRVRNTAQLFVDTGHGFSSRQRVDCILSPNAHEITFDLSRFTGVQDLRLDLGEDMVIVHINRVLLIDQSGVTHELAPSRSNALMHVNKDLYFETTDPQIFIPCPIGEPVSLIVHFDFIARGRAAVEPLLGAKRRSEIQRLNAESFRDQKKIVELMAQLTAASEAQEQLQAQISDQQIKSVSDQKKIVELMAQLTAASEAQEQLQAQISDQRIDMRHLNRSVDKLDHLKSGLEKTNASLMIEKEAIEWQLMQQYLTLLTTKRDSFTRHMRQLIRITEKLDRAVTRAIECFAWRAVSEAARLVKIVFRRPSQAQHIDEFKIITAAYYSWKGDYVVKLSQTSSNKVLKQLNDKFSRGEVKEAFTNARALASRLRLEIDTFSSDCDLLDGFYKKAAQSARSLLTSYQWRVGHLVTSPLYYLLYRPRPLKADKILSIIDFYEEWNLTHRLPTKRTVCEPAIRFNTIKVSAAAEKSVGDDKTNLALVGESPVVGLGNTNIIQFTPPRPRNPYYWMVGEQLNQRGISYSYKTNRDELIDFLRCNSASKNIVHFHQLDPLYHDRGGCVYQTTIQSRELLSYLEMLKNEGAILVHTHHNPKPHHNAYRDIDIEVQMRAWKLFDHFVVLGQLARRAVRKHVPDDKISVIKHPSFDGVYGPAVPKSQARERLGMAPNNFIFGCLGEIKPYKGIEFMIEGFERACRLIDPGLQPELHIIGNPGPLDYVKSITEMAPPNVFVRPELIADGEMAFWLGSFDAALFSLNGMWVSSSVILAASYGVPVVCPSVGCIPEYIDNENNGYLYRHGCLNDFSKKVEMMCSSKLATHFKYMTRLFNARLAIGGIADSYANLYEKLSK